MIFEKLDVMITPNTLEMNKKPRLICGHVARYHTFIRDHFCLHDNQTRHSNLPFTI